MGTSTISIPHHVLLAKNFKDFPWLDYQMVINETAITPENMSSQKEMNHFPTMNFQGNPLAVSFLG